MPDINDMSTAKQMKIRVAIVDDDALIRDSLRLILEMDPELAVAGTGTNGDEALELCRRTEVDVMLMDIRMPVCDGIMGTKKIKEAYPRVKVLILTTFQDDEYIFQALKNGADGYLLKNTPSAQIKEQIKLAHQGTMLIHGAVAQKLSEMLNAPGRYGLQGGYNKREGGGAKEKDLSKYGLTERECEIIKLVSEGLSNKEIAEQLFLGESTVKNYISAILDKLNLRDRTQIAVFYLKR